MGVPLIRLMPLNLHCERIMDQYGEDHYLWL